MNWDVRRSHGRILLTGLVFVIGVFVGRDFVTRDKI